MADQAHKRLALYKNLFDWTADSRTFYIICFNKGSGFTKKKLHNKVNTVIHLNRQYVDMFKVY